MAWGCAGIKKISNLQTKISLIGFKNDTFSIKPRNATLPRIKQLITASSAIQLLCFRTKRPLQTEKYPSLQPTLKRYAAWTWCVNRTLRCYRVFDVCSSLHRTLSGYDGRVKRALQKAPSVMALTTARNHAHQNTPAFHLLSEKHCRGSKKL